MGGKIALLDITVGYNHWHSRLVNLPNSQFTKTTTICETMDAIR